MICFHSRIEIQALYYIVQTHTVQDRAKELLWAKWMLSTLSAESVRLLRGINRAQCEFRETRRQLDLPNSVEEQTVRTSAELTLFALQSCALLEISFLSSEAVAASGSRRGWPALNISHLALAYYRPCTDWSRARKQHDLCNLQMTPHTWKYAAMNFQAYSEKH